MLLEEDLIMRKLVLVVAALFAIFAFIQAYSSAKAGTIPPGATPIPEEVHSSR